MVGMHVTLLANAAMTNDFFAYALSIITFLALAALSGYVCERAGVVNIGIEGMMCIGALIAAIIGVGMKTTKADQVWIAIIAAVVGGVFALLHGFASISLKSNQVISGTALNVLALGITAFVCTAGIYGQSNGQLMAGYQPITLDKNGIVPMWLIVAAVMIVVLFIFFTFTKWGMRYKMVGENPNAVDAAGISVIKYRYAAVFLSGMIAGFGGAVLLMVNFVGGTLNTAGVQGMGFLGLAILIVGQWNIGWISLASIVFGFLYTLGFKVGNLTTGDTNPIKSNGYIFSIIPYVLTIIMMVVFSKWSHAPAADGEPFDKAMR